MHFDASDKPEFDGWRWVDYWLPMDEVVDFKREVYRRALTELAPLLGQQAQPDAHGRRRDTARPAAAAGLAAGRLRRAGQERVPAGELDRPRCPRRPVRLPAGAPRGPPARPAASTASCRTTAATSPVASRACATTTRARTPAARAGAKLAQSTRRRARPLDAEAEFLLAYDHGRESCTSAGGRTTACENASTNWSGLDDPEP